MDVLSEPGGFRAAPLRRGSLADQVSEIIERTPRLALGRCLWGGAEADVARILVSEEKEPEFDGDAYVGLHHPRIS